MKQWMHKAALWTMALAMVIGTLTGCGKKAGEPVDPEGWETAVEKGELEIQQGVTGDGNVETWEHDSTVLEHEEYSVISEESYRGHGIHPSTNSESSSTGRTEESSETSAESAENSVDLTEESTEESVEESTETVMEETEAEVISGHINPLSGEAMAEDVSRVRPYVFAFNNHFAAIPQRGIAQSDLIIEYLIESQVTRYTAFFMPWKMTGVMGSIQGTRGVTSELAVSYDGILVHCGGDDASMGMLTTYQVDHMDETGTNIQNGAMFRDLTRQRYGTEHSLFGYGEKLVEAAENVGMREEHAEDFDGTYGFLFSENAAEQCSEKAENVLVTFDGGKTSEFNYREDLNGYILTQYGQELVDEQEEETITDIAFANVLNLWTPAQIQSDGIHVTNDLSQGGEGVFFTGGKAVKILWTKGGAEDVFYFVLEDGTPLEFSVGRTYICLNQDGSTRYQGTCTWE